jgi:hypothetical protein
MLRFILQSSVRREVTSILKTQFNICSVFARGVRIHSSSFMASQEIDDYRKKAKLAVCFHCDVLYFNIYKYVYIVLLVMSMLFKFNVANIPK